MAKSEVKTKDMFVHFYRKTGGYRINDPASVNEHTKWHLSHGAYGCPPVTLTVGTTEPKKSDGYGDFEW